MRSRAAINEKKSNPQRGGSKKHRASIWARTERVRLQIFLLRGNASVLAGIFEMSVESGVRLGVGFLCGKWCVPNTDQVRGNCCRAMGLSCAANYVYQRSGESPRTAWFKQVQDGGI